jgi:DNA-binding MarR family transcriptional regulator
MSKISTNAIARELSLLIPKLITGVRASFFEIEELTNRQIIVLLFIYESGVANISSIAKNFSVSLATITGIVDRLVKRGYLKRKRDTRDRRIVYVSLSSKGARFVGDFLSIVRKRWKNVLKFLNEQERRAYLKILKKIVKALNQER